MIGSNKNADHFEATVRQVAERSAATTLSQLGQVLEQMNPDELRGYVRAHAWPRICAEAKRLERNAGLSREQSRDLTVRALEQTVHFVLHSCAATPIVAMPMPHIGLRAAA